MQRCNLHYISKAGYQRVPTLGSYMVGRHQAIVLTVKLYLNT